MATRARIAAMPASFFGIVLGLGGLAGAWRTATQLWGMPPVIGDVIGLSAAAIWFVLTAIYLAKWLRFRQEALAEFRHPILCCFVGIIPLSAALVSLSIRPHSAFLAGVMAVFGIVGQLTFGVFRTGELWKGGRHPSTTTPVLYLPTVAGSFVSAIVLSAYGEPSWAAPFFGAGLLSWLAIESVLIHRLYTEAELSLALRPVLGIQLAPPAVGALAYLSFSKGAPDMVVQFLLGYALFEALVLLRLLPWIARQPFGASYWAFTFGMTAMSSAMLQFAERGGTGPLTVLAPYVFIAVNLAMALIALGTLRLLLQGRILPPPPAPAAATP